MSEKKTEKKTPYTKCVIRKKKEGKSLEQARKSCKELKK